MPNLITSFEVNGVELSSELLYSFIRSEKYISYYSNGKKYFLFLFRNKIVCLSEWMVALILCSLTFISIVGTRKLIKKFKLRKKMKKLSRRE